MKAVPVWISWLKYVSIIYWGWNLLLKIEFRNRSYPCADIIASGHGSEVGGGGAAAMAARCVGGGGRGQHGLGGL